MDKKNRDRQLRYLTQSIRLKETASPRLVRLTMMAVSLSIVGFFAWAAVADVREIAHTPGEIVPNGFQQVVQHFDGGIVREILVHEGDSVDKRQILLRLSGAGIEEDLKRAEAQDHAYRMQEERLRALVEGRAPSLPPGEHDQQAFFDSRTAAQQQEGAVIREQIAQKQQSVEALVSDLRTATENLVILDDLYRRRQQLFDMGYLPEMKLLETRQSYNQLQGQINNLKSQIEVAKSAIAEYERRLSSLAATDIDDASQRLDAVISAAAQNREVIDKLKGRVGRLDVRAPVRGIVKGLAVNTIGGVVLPGQTLMEIVPSDMPLIVSLKIQPKYIGHVKKGQNLQIKVSSYDFSRYGSVRGRLDFISAATFTAENGERYYQGRASLEKDYIGHDRDNVFVPGMTVMADIVTGNKTVLEYLLKPIRNALSTAFTER